MKTGVEPGPGFYKFDNRGRFELEVFRGPVRASYAYNALPNAPMGTLEMTVPSE